MFLFNFFRLQCTYAFISRFVCLIFAEGESYETLDIMVSIKSVFVKMLIRNGELQSDGPLPHPYPPLWVRACPRISFDFSEVNF